MNYYYIMIYENLCRYLKAMKFKTYTQSLSFFFEIWNIFSIVWKKKGNSTTKLFHFRSILSNLKMLFFV